MVLFLVYTQSWHTSQEGVPKRAGPIRRYEYADALALWVDREHHFLLLDQLTVLSISEDVWHKMR